MSDGQPPIGSRWDGEKWVPPDPPVGAVWTRDGWVMPSTQPPPSPRNAPPKKPMSGKKIAVIAVSVTLIFGAVLAAIVLKTSSASKLDPQANRDARPTLQQLRQFAFAACKESLESQLDPSLTRAFTNASSAEYVGLEDFEVSAVLQLEDDTGAMTNVPWTCDATKIAFKNEYSAYAQLDSP
jgi:hypothetical protein